MLVSVSLPLAVLSIDFTGIIVALPTIGADLDVPASNLGWVVNAFALGFAGLLLIAGKLSDRVGHRAVLLAGLVVFATGSIACGTAQTFPVLVAGRLVQGLGTACFMTASLALVAAAYDEGDRPRAIGLWGAVGGAASAVGPLVGGALTEWASWRWFFLVNLPLLTLSIVLALRTIPRPPLPVLGTTRPSFDLAGAAVGTSGIVLLVLGLQEAGDHPAGSPVVWASLVCGAGALLAFLAIERRANDPLVDAALLRRRAYVRPTTAALVANIGFGALQLLLTFQLQGQKGWSPLATGMAFLAYSIPFAVLGAQTGRLAGRWSLLTLLSTGLVVVSSSFVVLALLDPLPTLAVAGALVLGGVGQGLVYSASSTAAMGAAPEDEAGVASGVLGVARNLGLATGIAVATIASQRPDDFATGVAAAAVLLALLTAATAAWSREGAGDLHPDVS